MKKFWNWLRNLFNRVEEEVEETHVSVEELSVCNNECKCSCDCHCDDCENTDDGCKEADVADTYKEYLMSIDWDNLTVNVIDELNRIDLNCYCDDLINWYRISKFKGLPDEFIRKYKDKIIWSEYNKSYMKKATREMLRAEGYFN